MRRREFLARAGTAITTWPLQARAQQSVMPVIGYLSLLSSDAVFPPYWTAFHDGLQEANYVEGKNVAIEYRWADGQYDLLPVLAAELVRRGVNLLAIASGGTHAASAAKSATSTIPIVALTGGDMATFGLVDSLGRPGGNLTGINVLAGPLNTKRFELLCELVPRARVVAALVNPRFARTDVVIQGLQQAADARGIRLLVVAAEDENSIEVTFGDLVKRNADALLVTSDPSFNLWRAQLISSAVRHALPASYDSREFTVLGGLISYGANFADAYRQLGTYAGRILRGANPADLPIEQSTRIELAINLKTAKATGLVVPESLIARADEVIE